MASAKARRVYAALVKLGWELKRQTGSHRTMARAGWQEFVFAFHDSDEIGPRMLARIAKHTGLQPEDLWRGEHGCVSHAVHQDVENRARLVFVEEWTDHAALMAHFAAPATRAFARAIGNLAVGTPSLNIFEARRVER